MRSVTSSGADAAFAALAAPARRRVLELLRDRGTLTAGELAAAFPEMRRPSVSKHLRVLRGSGLVRATRSGREWRYRLEAGPLVAIERDWLATFVPLYEDSLQRLKERVENDAGG